MAVKAPRPGTSCRATSCCGAGVDPDADFRGLPNFSGSHDKTWKLVESGAYQAGALNEAVWSKAAESGRVDLGKVRVLWTTDPYYDYNWTVRPDLDETFGSGFTERLRDALLTMAEDADGRALLEAFQTDSFIATANENYSAIEDVARKLGMIE